ncbi:MAG: hypothetical protein HKM28_03725 [Flavobacteriaceae bacterium]|nr:hypothetical protein [Flavobacteriaceae bacterium]
MKNDKDIGEMIADSLQEAADVSTNLKWQQVENSLNKRDRKTRFLKYFFFGMALVIVGLSALYFIKNEQAADHSLEKIVTHTSKEEKTETNDGKIEPIKNTETLVVEFNENIASEKIESNPTSASSKIHHEQQRKDRSKTGTAATKYTSPLNSEISGKHSSSQKSKNDVFETFQLDSVTTYSYFDQATQRTIITTRIETIDSLKQLSRTKSDSLR